MQSLAKPTEANAQALANLFPATKKSKFDPLCVSVNAESQRKQHFQQRKTDSCNTILYLYQDPSNSDLWQS